MADKTGQSDYPRDADGKLIIRKFVMLDENLYGEAGADAPASFAFLIEPDDDNDLATPTRGIYLGTGGDLAVTMIGGGDAVTFKSLAAGVVHPLRVLRVMETDTTASDIVGVY